MVPQFGGLLSRDFSGLPGSGGQLIVMVAQDWNTWGKQLCPPQGTPWRQETGIHPQSSFERGSLPSFHRCDQSGRLPITHTFQGRLQSSSEHRETRGTIFVPSAVPFQVLRVSKKRASVGNWFSGWELSKLRETEENTGDRTFWGCSDLWCQILWKSICISTLHDIVVQPFVQIYEMSKCAYSKCIPFSKFELRFIICNLNYHNFTRTKMLAFSYLTICNVCDKTFNLQHTCLTARVSKQNVGSSRKNSIIEKWPM